jgi:crotonobetaine/carnitine-CoA ligase
MLHLLAARAAAEPDRTWLVFDGLESLSFGDAQRRVNGFAQAVAARLEPGDAVALLLRNEIDFIPAFYGPMAAGCLTVPLNGDSRGPLLEDVLDRSHARILVVRADLLARLRELDSLGDVELLVVVGAAEGAPPAPDGVEALAFEDFIAGRPQTAPRPLPDSSETCLIQFTSGTTGGSKGVVYSHHFLYLYSALLVDGQERTPDEVLTTPLPLFHVAALHHVAGGALHAGCLGHIKSRFSASAFWEQAAADGATWAIFLGPMAELVLKAVDRAPAHRVENIFCVPFPPNGEAFERRFGVKLQWQGYGMTEIYPLPMARRMSPGADLDLIGSPPPWIDFGVVDQHDRMLAPGEVGELVFRTGIPDSMASGYLDDPATSARAFRNFMFHTGDLASYDEEAMIHYRGRGQDRIRRRGENVSAVELEFIAMRHPDVVEAAAYGVPGELGEDEIKLDVVAQGVELDALHAWLVERLPRFAVPRYLEAVEEMPKTPSQKIAKYKLAERGLGRVEVHAFEPPAREVRV